VADKKMTNIRLDPVLWARVKGAAGQRGITLERWVSEALEAQLYRGGSAATEPAAPPAAAENGAPPPAPGGADAAAPADPLRALHWRVEALEQAVDYLAGVVGAGFPLSAGEAAAGGRPAAGGPEKPDAGPPPPGAGAGPA
jgi:hypothetical protein